MNTSNLNYLGPPGTLGKALTVAPFAEANRTGTSGAAPDSRRSRSCARIHKIVGGGGDRVGSRRGPHGTANFL